MVSKLLLWPKRSQSDRVTEKGIRDPTSPCPPGHPLGLLLACSLGWQGHESDPQGTVPLSPFSAGHSVPGSGPGMTPAKPGPSLEAPWRFRPSWRNTRGKGTHSLAPPTSGSPFQAGGRRSQGCSGHSSVRSHEAGRCTGRSPGHRVSARRLSPPGRSCKLGVGVGAGKGGGEPCRSSVQPLGTQERQRRWGAHRDDSRSAQTPKHLCKKVLGLGSSLSPFSMSLERQPRTVVVADGPSEPALSPHRLERRPETWLGVRGRPLFPLFWAPCLCSPGSHETRGDRCCIRGKDSGASESGANTELLPAALLEASHELTHTVAL